MSVVVAQALSCLPTVAIGVIRNPHARPGGDARTLLDRPDPVALEIRQRSTYDCNLCIIFALL
jgi:hypothetical protein